MKKKLMIIFVMLLVCTGMFVLAQKAQSSVIDKKNKAEAAVANKSSENKNVVDNKVETDKATETPKEENKEQAAANSTESKPNNSNGSEEGKPSSKQTTSTQPNPGPPAPAPSTPVVVPVTPKKDSNFAIIDEVNNKIIIEKKVDFDNVTIDFITCKLLKEAGINYGNDDEGSSSSYFYSIAGLTERKAGPLSGWCFYLNGKKPGMGAGSYIYHKGDVLVWKYMRDAVNSK